jgi:hypothetical protein
VSHNTLSITLIIRVWLSWQIISSLASMKTSIRHNFVVKFVDRSMHGLEKLQQQMHVLLVGRRYQTSVASLCTQYSKSTTNPQLFDKSTTSRHVKMLWICCGFDKKIHNKSKQWSMAFDLSTASRKAVQQIHNFTTSRTTCCTTNPQQIHNKSNKWSLSF